MQIAVRLFIYLPEEIPANGGMRHTRDHQTGRLIPYFALHQTGFVLPSLLPLKR